MSELSRYKLRCRRGMKELDFILDRYLSRDFPQASPAELAQFDELLELQDPILFGYLFGLEATPSHLQALAAKIRGF